MNGAARGAVATTLMLGAACAGRGPGADARTVDTAAPPRVDGPPQLDRVEPDTVRLRGGDVPRVVLHGRGFAYRATPLSLDDTVNTVMIGIVPFGPLNATPDGTRLEVAIATTETAPGARGRPRGLATGTYPVTVITRRGTSAARSLTLIP